MIADDDCCEKKAKNETFLNKLLSKWRCSCERYQPIEENATSFEDVMPQEHKKFFKTLFTDYFKEANLAAEKDTFVFGNFDLEYDSETMRLMVNGCTHLTHSERVFLRKVFLHERHCAKILFFVCRNLPPPLRNDFLLICSFIIEEYIADAKNTQTNVVQHQTHRIKGCIGAKFKLLAKELTSIYPPVKAEKQHKLEMAFKNLMTSSVQSIVASLEGYYIVDVPLSKKDNKAMTTIL